MKNAPREWYRIRCEADAAVAEIWIYDIIGADWFGDGVTAKNFLAELRALPESAKTLRVHVNSPGGDVFDAVAIANLLRAQSQEKGRTIEMLVEGLAASAATIITSAGDSIKIASNAMMMVHNPSGMVWGEAKDMRSMADALDSIRDAIVATYRWVSQLSATSIQALMDAITWMSAEEALANGFATEIMEPVKVEARFRPEALAKLGTIPDAYRERVAALVAPQASDPVPVSTVSVVKPPEPPSPPAPPAVDVEGILALCKAGGCSIEFVEGLIAEHVTVEQAQARIAEATEIRGLCATAKLSELADGYIRNRLPVADVRAQLTLITARMDAVEIDTTLPADGDRPARPASRLNPSAVYAERSARVGQRGA